MKRPSGLAVSPDGKWAVVSVSEPAYDPAAARSDLWIVPVDGSAPARRLTQNKQSEGEAVFSPDSRTLAFTSKREGDSDSQVYALPLDGGEARRVTSIPAGATNPRWRPDGKAILFESLVPPPGEDTSPKYKALIFETSPVRHWDRWLDGKKPHIFTQSLDDGAKPVDVLAGSKLAASPGFDGVRATGDAELEAVWSPDGASIVFTARVNQDTSTHEAGITRLFRVPASGGEPSAITTGRESYSNAVFAPNGKALFAKVERSEDDALYSASRLVRIDWPPSGAGPKPLTENWDRTMGSVAFSPDSSRIYMTAEEHGHDKIFAMSANGGAVTPVLEVKSGCYEALAIPAKTAGTKLVALWGSMTHPLDIAVVEPGASSHRLLTDFHSAKLAGLDLPEPRHFWFTAKNGKRIHSTMVVPPGFDPAKKYPLLLFPHGGPHNMSKDHFFFRWNEHLLTAPGYVLLSTNYTGSTGFGEEFAAAIHRDILRGPAGEIEEAADAAIREFPFIDGSRQAAAGASYGGYLMNWFEGNSTRFRCLVNHAGLTDNTSMWGATDGALYWERRVGGPVWEQKGAWRDQSPSAYAANFKTPMLITHGERDFRVPVNQALDIYKLLQRRQVPARLVVFPGENHWVLSGENARFHMKEVAAWLARHLR